MKHITKIFWAGVLLAVATGCASATTGAMPASTLDGYVPYWVEQP